MNGNLERHKVAKVTISKRKARRESMIHGMQTLVVSHSLTVPNNLCLTQCKNSTRVCYSFVVKIISTRQTVSVTVLASYRITHTHDTLVSDSAWLLPSGKNLAESAYLFSCKFTMNYQARLLRSDNN
jgi:polysaccharide pyruvyl transferase WcaK-like protein